MRWLPGKPTADWLRPSLPAGVSLTSFTNTQGKTTYTDQQGKEHELGSEMYAFDLAFKNAHPSLMAEWSRAVKAFHDDLVRLKQDRRVLMFTFSEFGRRVKENFSQGTDHGVAGPAFLYGTPVAGGVIGEHPSLTDLDKGDLRSAIDFRTIYAGIARDWMRADHQKVVGDFEPLSFLA